jgi:hypothetical protein
VNAADHIAPGELPTKRLALYQDARSARHCGESADEWRASVAANAVLSGAAEAVGERTVEAIAGKVWGL